MPKGGHPLPASTPQPDRFNPTRLSEADVHARTAVERRYHNDNADLYVRKVERGDIFHLPDARLLYRHLPLNDRASTTILDAGCGPASSVRRFLMNRLRPVDRYVGVDFAERLLQVAGRDVPSGQFVHLDLEQLRLSPESVDAVLCLGALHHLPRPMQVLGRLLDGLRPGGLLLLREPSDRAFRRGQGESPEEEGLNVDELKAVVAGRSCRIEQETYLTSWAFVHLRHHLQRLHLGTWERSTFLWRLKLQAELALEAVAGKRLPRLLKGLDLYMVIRRPRGSGPTPGTGSIADIESIFACPDCGGQLPCPCGTRLSRADGLWSLETLRRFSQ